jgi:hypothetical protein
LFACFVFTGLGLGFGVDALPSKINFVLASQPFQSLFKTSLSKYSTGIFSSQPEPLVFQSLS